LLLGAAGLGCLAAATAAQAQEGDSTEIIVTANKRSENIAKVGLTITAMSGETMQERKVVSLEDVTSIVPGLVYTPSTTNTPIFTLRGVGFNESSLGVYPAVSVYIDQAPLPFPVLASHTAFDLERVEVLKGPQGTLFGQNSTGGAINYIAAKPTSSWQAGGEIGYGRFNQVDGNAFISGPLSDTVRVRISSAALHSGDWQTSYTRRDTNGHQSYVAGRFLLDWDASEKLKFSLNVNGWVDKSQPQAQQLIAIHETVANAGGPADPFSADPVNDPNRNFFSPPLNGQVSAQLGYPFSPFNPRAADWSTRMLDPGTVVPSNGDGTINNASAGYSDFDPWSDRKFWQTALRGDLDITDDITLTSLTSYSHYTQQQQTDGDGMYLVAYDLQRGEGAIKSFSQELRLANNPSNAFRWLLGGNFEKSKTYEDQYLRYYSNSNYYAPNLYINSSGETLNQNIRNVAFFASLEYSITETLTLKAAGRYTESRIRARNFAYTGPSGNVDKLFNILGGLSGLPFTPIGPNDSYTLNGIPVDASGNLIPLSKDLTILSPMSQGGALGLGVPGFPMEAVLKQNNTSWRFGLDWQANPSLLLYANVSRGYKAGSFPALAAASYVTALPVTQESVTAFEAGFKASMMDKMVQINAAAFYYDYKDKQVRGKLFDLVFGTLDTLVNIPKSRIWGLEADVSIRPVDGLTISLAGTYLNSKIKEFVGYDIFGGVDNANYSPGQSNVEDLSGNPLPYTPKWSGSFNIDYKFDTGGSGTPFVGLSLNAKSGQDAAIGGGVSTLPINNPTKQNRYRIAPGVGLYPYTIKGYATLDVRAGYEAEDGRWRVMFWGKNVTNKYYWTAVIPSSDSSARFAGRPATYGVTFGFKFN